MSDIVMPRLSDTMEEGTILRWLRQDGAEISRGEELVEIETDKATMTYESDQSGVLQTLAAEGDSLPVGAVIARVGDRSGAEEAPAAVAEGERSSNAERAVDRSRSPAAAASAIADPGGASGSSPTGQPRPAADGGRVKASPLARRIARERGLDLGSLSGSGPGGRIVKADVATAGGETRAAPAPAPAAPAGPASDVMTAKGQTTEVELSRTQQTIARRMAESKATIPDFNLLTAVDMEECVALRTQLKRLSRQGAGGEGEGAPQLESPTYNDMVVKAAALALREHPRANASYRDGRLQLHSRINVGVAVAAEESLLVPTVFDADSKALGEIARETRALAARVRDGSITPPELGGGTFTVSNLGMFGVRSFTAIINPPQAAIMSVGAAQQRAVVREGAVVPRHTMTLTLVCDHRILYGAEAALFLARVRELLETPSALTL